MGARWDRLTALPLLVFAGYMIVAGWRMGYWQGRIPGPGFAPIWIGAGLALAALMLLLRPAPSRAGLHPAMFAGAPLPAPPTERRDRMREGALALQIAAVTIAAMFLIPRVGMMTAMGLLLLAMVKLLAGSWRAAILTAVVLPVAFYAVFVRWLQVPVPKGPLGF